jgi:serine protease Do
VGSSLRALALPILLAASAAAQEAHDRLQKLVESASKGITERFIFFGGGSGVLISGDGYCLTNHHVVASGQKNEAVPQARVTLHSGKQYFAKLVCTDDRGDLALYKLQGAEGETFPFAELGDSDKLEPGQSVIACGNPFGITLPDQDRKMYPTITLGIVSAVHRYQGGYSDCIQTDAAVNPGNSGGPLITLDGKVVGINGRIATRYFNRVNSGVGYAIPSRQIRNFLPAMMKGGEGGKIAHGQITGLFLEEPPARGQGAQVLLVAPGSAAEQAGFRKGDLLVEVAGQKTFGRERFLGALGTHPVGAEVTVKAKRGAETLDLKVKLDRHQEGFGFRLPTAPRPAPQRPPGSGYLGLYVDELKEGLSIQEVRPGSPADLADLRPGDLIVRVGNRTVATRDELNARIWQRKPGDKVKLGIKRGAESLDVEVTLGKHPED